MGTWTRLWVAKHLDLWIVNIEEKCNGNMSDNQTQTIVSILSFSSCLLILCASNGCDAQKCHTRKYISLSFFFLSLTHTQAHIRLSFTLSYIPLTSYKKINNVFFSFFHTCFFLSLVLPVFFVFCFLPSFFFSFFLSFYHHFIFMCFSFFSSSFRFICLFCVFLSFRVNLFLSSFFLSFFFFVSFFVSIFQCFFSSFFKSLFACLTWSEKWRREFDLNFRPKKFLGNQKPKEPKNVQLPK